MRTGDAYAWTGHFNQSVTGTPNGLNQLTQVGTKSLTHDARGNVTAFGTRSFTYSSENLLLTGPNSSTLTYDPLSRLSQVTSTSTKRFNYDGLDRIAERDGSNALLRRYVYGVGTDEPIVWYEGSGTADRRFLSADERGSIISVTDGSGALLGINRYDEFGQPQASNIGAFGYTGQAWLSEVGLWYYKARVYDPELGRFLQTDPAGYEDSANLYAYVLNDPVNVTDPFGMVAIIITKYVSGPSCPGAASGVTCYAPGSGFSSGTASGYRRIAVKTPSPGGVPGVRGPRIRSARTGGCDSPPISENEAQWASEGNLALLSVTSSPTAGQIADYHFDVFAAHDLPRTTFGGAPVTGTETEAELTSGIWLRCP